MAWTHGLDTHVVQALVELFLYLSAAELRRDEEIRPSKTGLADSLPDVRFGGVFWGVIMRDLSREMGTIMGERTLGRVDVAEAGVDRRSDIFDHTLLLPLGAGAVGDCGNLSDVNEGMYVSKVVADVPRSRRSTSPFRRPWCAGQGQKGPLGCLRRDGRGVPGR